MCQTWVGRCMCKTSKFIYQLYAAILFVSNYLMEDGWDNKSYVEIFIQKILDLMALCTTVPFVASCW